MMSIKRNVAQVMDRITVAARRAGRDPAEVTLVTVGKTFPAEAVVEVHRAGLSLFGENRVQEARAKIPAAAAILGEAAVSWIQRRKRKWGF